VGGSEFVVSGISFPATIAAGQSANFTVTFTPQTAGLASVSAVFNSNASNSPASATLSGTGVAAPVHTVVLNWNASSSQDVIGYNVYRRTGSTGSYAQINSVLDAATTYTDTSVTDGQTYYYETTAVNSSNEESAPSTPLEVSIPAP
jgi:fibronectin type 3 domain-containing protein